MTATAAIDTTDTTTAATTTTSRSPIFEKFFARRPLLPGKVFDRPASQLFRLESSASLQLPQLSPTSRLIFNRRSGGMGLRADYLELAGGVGGVEFKAIDGKIGKKLCQSRELYLKKRLSQLHRVLQLFK